MSLKYNTDKEKRCEYFINLLSYFKKIHQIKNDSLIFIIPDKNVICKDNLSEMYEDIYKSPNFIYLNNHNKLDPSDYYMNNSNINDKGLLKLTKSIMKFFINNDDEINKIDNNLKTTLEGEINNETIVRIDNIHYDNYINNIIDIDVKYRYCLNKPSEYVHNTNAIIKKKILVFGSSNIFNKIITFLSFYFEDLFLYRNHLFINNDLITNINPDIIIDLHDEKLYNMNDTFLSYDDIYSILVFLDDEIFNNIITNINNLNEIKNNLQLFSYLLNDYKHLIKPYIDNNIITNNDLINKLKHVRSINKEKIPKDFNAKNYIELNLDLRHMSEDEATNHYECSGYKENRKYKYENIPENFNPKYYINFNNDLSYMSENEALKHYEYFGYKENRKYKFENIPNDFNPKYYLQLNNDLNYMSENEAKFHYELYGNKENRKYKFENLPNDYLNNNNEHQCEGVNDSEEPKYKVEDTKLFPFNEHNIINNNYIYNEKIYYNNYETLHSNDLFITRKFLSEKHHEYLNYNIDNNILDMLNKFILVLDFNNGGGGTTFFINTIVSKYNNNQTFVIARNYDDLLHLNINEIYDLNYRYSETESIIFLNKYKNNISKIFINHLYNHNINFINQINKLGKEIITITHDYYNICEIPQPLFHEIEKNYIEPRIQSSLLITQHKINISSFVRKHNKLIKIIELPDYKKPDIKIDCTNDNIVVAIIGNINNLKGKPILEKIIEHYKDTNIKIIVIGYLVIDNIMNCYNYNSIEEFNNILIEQKPNIILELSIWPETYSYVLSLSMITQLPILCLKKKFNSVIEDRLKNYSKSYYFSSLPELDKLIKTKYQNYLYTILPILYYNTEWNNIFLTKTKKLEIVSKSEFIYNIKPYFIYFPQFHKIKENDLFFYENFTDIQNLKLYNLSNHCKLDSPLLDYLNLENIDDYILTNKNIIQKQINIINHYNFSGIAIYFYWFSNNNITYKNQIMEDVINQFFTSNIDMLNLKIFFIWPNENWTSNKAFGINESYDIINNYNKENFIKLSNKLNEYFKHDYYLKINNKPVFIIYHNDLIKNEDIDLFYNILNDICIKNKFNGVHFVLNSYLETNKSYPSCYINFNYKKNESRFFNEKTKECIIDYKKYLDNNYHFKGNCINTIVTQFNNKARLFKPNRLHLSTCSINNSEINKIIFIKKIINLYKNSENSELNKILLINSFNEWGEDMAFEPSEKYKYYNLNLLFECLKNTFNY